jgi:hypothetical protein
MFKFSRLSKYLVAAVLLSAVTGAFARWTDAEFERVNLHYMVLPAPINVPAGRTVESVKANILAALRLHGWTGVESAPGVIDATYNRANKHILTASVKYDASRIVVGYKSSTGLKYEDGPEPKLHKTGSGWMKLLATDIQTTVLGH